MRFPRSGPEHISREACSICVAELRVPTSESRRRVKKFGRSHGKTEVNISQDRVKRAAFAPKRPYRTQHRHLRACEDSHASQQGRASETPCPLQPGQKQPAVGGSKCSTRQTRAITAPLTIPKSVKQCRYTLRLNEAPTRGKQSN